MKPGMTDKEILTLCAKDYVVRTHGQNILNWSVATWDAAVLGIRIQFTDETLKNAKKVYQL